MDERTMVYLDDVVEVIYQALRTPLPDYHKDPFHDSMGVAMAMVNEIPPAKSEQRWIPVTERLPEEHEWMGTKKFGTTISDEVYVTFENPKGERFCKHISFQNGKLSSFDQSAIDAFYKGSKPIAWMPLPKAWKGGMLENEITLTLNSPITDEEFDAITDVDMENTPRIIFHTKNGKEVEYVKVVRCEDCKHNPKKELVGCPMAHLNERQRPEDAWCWKGERDSE